MERSDLTKCLEDLRWGELSFHELVRLADVAYLRGETLYRRDGHWNRMMAAEWYEWAHEILAFAETKR